MKNTLLYGLLTSIIALIVSLSLILLFDSFLFSVYIFFIVPGFAMIFGYYVSKGLAYGMVKRNIIYSYKIHLLLILYAIIFYFLIYYLAYHLARIDEGYLVFSLSGDHISNYVVEGYGRIDFKNFMKLILNSYSVTKYVSFNRAITIDSSYFLYDIASQFQGTYSLSQNYLFIYLIIDLIGIIVGGFSSGLNLKEIKWCKECKKYHKKKLIARFERSLFEKNILDNLVQDMTINKLLRLNYIEERFKKDLFSKESYVDIYAEYCPECKNSDIFLRYYFKDFLKYEFDVRKTKTFRDIDVSSFI